MKLKVLFRPNVSPLLSVKAALINKRLGTAKIYELLHKQIWRKARKTRVATRKLPMFRYYNGRPVEFISFWNIQSSSVDPYSKDAPLYSDVTALGDPLFGLNQFFMMSKNDPEADRKSKMTYHYDKPYPGSPSIKNGGIYADYCYIEPKVLQMVSGSINQWSYSNPFDEYAEAVVFKELSSTGMRLVSSASVEFKEYPDAKGNPVQWVVVKCIPESGDAVYYKMEKAVYPLAVYQSWLGYGPSGTSYVLDRKAYEDQLAATHKGLKFRLSLEGAEYPLTDWVYTYNASKMFPSVSGEKGYILVYGDGMVVEYVPYHYEGGDGGVSEEAHYKVLPMVYTDTGDLAMSRSDFVDNWADMFTLVVAEKRSFLERIATPIIAVIAVVIAFYTAGALGWGLWGTLVMAGGVVTAIGILGKDNKMMAIGGILGAIGSIGSILSNIGTQSAAVIETEYAGTLARTGGATVMQNATEASGIGAIFDKLTSSSGLGNLVRIGKSSFDLFQSVNSLGTSDESVVAMINEDTKRIEAEFGPAALEEYTEEYNVPMIVVKPHIEVLQTMKDI